MCVRPLYLIRKCEHCDFLEDSWRHYKLQRVPCGKCIECVKRRQNDIAVRIATEAQNFNTMHFVTLTYKPETIPLSCSLYMRDGDSLYLIQKPRILPDCDKVKEWRLIMENFDMFRSAPERREGCFLDFQFPQCGFDTERYFYRVAFSLNREDFKNWMKGCRVAYQRKFGCPLPDFKLAWCGEYGSRTARPHYHCLFLGLNDFQVHWMVDRWDKGFTLWKRCNTQSRDKYAVARYVSKYMSKESEFVATTLKMGLAQKPRFALSRYMGYCPNLSRPYFFAFDLFGEYDPQTLILKSTKKKLDARQLDAITDAVSSRLRCFVPGCDYSLPIPRSWLYQIYYKKVKNDEKKTQRFVPCRLFKIVQETLLSRELANRERKFVQFARSSGATSVSEALLWFNATSASDAAAREIAGRKSEIAFYSSDAF